MKHQHLGARTRLCHAIYRLYGCNPAVLDNSLRLRQILFEAAKRAGMTVVGYKVHKFRPHGVTCAVLLAESHIHIHTYPQLRYHSSAIVDILACNPKNFRAACDYLLSSLNPQRVRSECRKIQL